MRSTLLGTRRRRRRCRRPRPRVAAAGAAVRLAGDYLRLQNLVVDKNAAYSSFDNVCNGAPNAQLYGQNDTLSGVEVRNSSMSGVYLEGADSARVVGNWIHDNGTHWNLD